MVNKSINIKIVEQNSVPDLQQDLSFLLNYYAAQQEQKSKIFLCPKVTIISTISLWNSR